MEILLTLFVTLIIFVIPLFLLVLDAPDRRRVIVEERDTERVEVRRERH